MGFIIERETKGLFQPVAIAPANTSSYSDAGLLPETTYRYRVVAYNAKGKSEYSDIDTLTTLVIPAPLPFNGPHTIPGKIEAEDFDANGEEASYHDTDEANRGGQYRTDTGVDIEKSTDSGSGYNLAYIVNGEWVTYLIESVIPGNYDIALRVASNITGTKRIDVYLDNAKLGSVTPTNTGGWQIWETKYIEDIPIADNQPRLLKLEFTGSDFNINWIEFGTNLSTSSYRIERNCKLKSYYDRNNQQIHLSSGEEIEQATVQVFNSVGQSFFNQYGSHPEIITIETPNWPKGIYLVVFSSKNERYANKVIID
jgi:hypothetical protein